MAKNDDYTPAPTPPSNDQSQSADRNAAADILRDDINRIFDGDTAPHKEAEDAARAEQTAHQAKKRQSSENTQDETQVHAQVANQWKHYHSSWQSYYQQYYERYYLNHLNRVGKQPTIPHQPAIQDKKEPIGSASEPEEGSAVSDLREQLLNTVKKQAMTARKSRHFAPVITAFSFAFIFLFLQYNSFLFATVQAYVSPGSIDSQNVIIDPSQSTKVGPEPKLVIPKINVEAPMVYGANPADNNEVENKLRDGVVHYPIANAASVPGQNGATVILGHSSNDVFDTGKYKFVFVQLSKMETGDTFSINYEGTRYTYSVTKKEVIEPTEINKVTADPNKPSVILITCEPPGTALKRLLLFADQVSPDPAKSTDAPAKPGNSNNTQSITGNSPTLVERLFGAQ